MPTIQKGQLFKLVKTLTKAEKRHFKLYAKKIQKKEDVLFLKLFEFLEKQDITDDKILLGKFKKVNKSQLTNLKRNLYQHLLISLRLLQSKKQVEIQIRQYTDFADILYGRGLYLQALKMLAKAKNLAQGSNLDLLHLEVIEFEKRIESRHITRSSTERMNEIIEESFKRTKVISSIVELTNLKLHLQRLFIKKGHIISSKDREEVTNYFFQNLRFTEQSPNTFFEKIYLFQAYFWYHYIMVDYETCLEYAQKWVRLYESQPLMIEEDVDMYMKGLQHKLTIAFFLKQPKLHRQVLDRFGTFTKEMTEKWNKNSNILFFLFYHQSKLDQCLLDYDYREGVEQIPKLKKQLNTYENNIDPHKLMIFNYKFACLHLGNAQPQKALDYILKIINSPSTHLRDDIQIYSRLLQCIIHFELGNFDLLDYLTRSTDRFTKRITISERLPITVLQFFKSLIKTRNQERRAVFIDFHNNLSKLYDQTLEKRGFVFFDFIYWVEQKILKSQTEKSNKVG